MSLSSQERFKSNIITLIEIFQDIFNEGKEYDTVDSYDSSFIIVLTLVKSTSSELMIENFIKKTYDHWDKIYSKDIDYFKDLGLNLFEIFKNKGVDHFKTMEKNSTLIEMLTGEQIKDFKKLLSSSYTDKDGKQIDFLNEERKRDIWLIFHSFVKISICYLHENTEKQKQFNYINVTDNIKKWKIKKLLN